jgi:hypothetical protein
MGVDQFGRTLKEWDILDNETCAQNKDNLNFKCFL